MRIFILMLALACVAPAAPLPFPKKVPQITPGLYYCGDNTIALRQHGGEVLYRGTLLWRIVDWEVYCYKGGDYVMATMTNPEGTYRLKESFKVAELLRVK